MKENNGTYGSEEQSGCLGGSVTRVRLVAVVQSDDDRTQDDIDRKSSDMKIHPFLIATVFVVGHLGLPPDAKAKQEWAVALEQSHVPKEQQVHEREDEACGP
jgi:hypothetical protein